MKQNVSLRWFYDNESWIFDDDFKIANLDIDGVFSQHLSDSEIKKLEATLGEEVISLKRSDAGVEVETYDKEDKNNFNYTWGNFGYYYKFGNQTSYVKFEEIIKMLYKKFGEEYRQKYHDFCIEVASEQKRRAIADFEASNAKTSSEVVKIQKARLAKKLSLLLTEQVKNQIESFDKLVGRKEPKAHGTKREGAEKVSETKTQKVQEMA
jgi:hypothetical protein